MTPAEAEERDRLLFHLENETGFWFALVIADEPGPRLRLFEAAEAWCKEHGRAFVLHEPLPGELVKLAITLAKGDSPGVHWIRADGVKGLTEQWNTAVGQMLMAMNERREAYRKRLDGGIIIEGRMELKRILRELAPDMFSVRAFIAEPGADSEVAEDKVPSWRPPTSIVSLAAAGADTERMLGRLSRLSALEDDPKSPGWFGAAMMAAGSLHAEGHHEDAANRYREILSRLEDGTLQVPEGKKAAVEASLHVMLADIDTKAGRHADALEHLNAARLLWSSFKTPDPDTLTFIGFFGLMTSELEAFSRMQTGDMAGARDVLRFRMSAFAAQSHKGSELDLDYLADHHSLVEVLKRMGDLDGAEETATAAVRLAEGHHETHPTEQRWRLEVVRSRLAVGYVLALKQDMDRALEALRPALALSESLEAAEPRNDLLRATLAPLYILLAMLQFSKNDHSEFAARAAERAIEHAEWIRQRAPDDTNNGWVLVSLYLYEVVLREARGDSSAAHEAAREAIALSQALPVGNDEQAKTKQLVDSLRSFVEKPPKKPRRRKRP